MPGRAAVVVAGMHRSGTSAMTGTLSLMGSALPHRLVPAGVGNERGHWEPLDAVLLNDEIVTCAGSETFGPLDFDPAWFETAAAAEFVIRAVRILSDGYDQAPLIVLKDPRISLTFPIWQRALSEVNIQARVVIMYRDPLDAARSFCDRYLKLAPMTSPSIDLAMLLWVRYNLAVERFTRGLPRAFVAYDRLLADWREVVRGLECRLDLEFQLHNPEACALVDNYLDLGEQHFRTDELEAVGAASRPWCEPLFALLRRREDDPYGEALAFDAMSADLRQLQNALSGYT